VYDGISRAFVECAVEVENVLTLVNVKELTDISAVGGNSGCGKV